MRIPHYAPSVYEYPNQYRRDNNNNRKRFVCKADTLLGVCLYYVPKSRIEILHLFLFEFHCCWCASIPCSISRFLNNFLIY